MVTALPRGTSTEASARRLWNSIDWAHGLGSMRTHAVGASVAATSGRLRLLEDVLVSARAARTARVAVEEALLQVYLFAGYPRAIEALGVLARTWPINGTSSRVQTQQVTANIAKRWRTQGELLCRRVYGKNYERLHLNIRAAHPDLAEWMIWEGYGKVLSRPGLDGISRELSTAAALVVLDAPRQLRAHVRGARNLGARANQIRLAVRLAALGCGAKQHRRTEAMVEEWLDSGAEE